MQRAPSHPRQRSGSSAAQGPSDSQGLTQSAASGHSGVAQGPASAQEVHDPTLEYILARDSAIPNTDAALDAALNLEAGDSDIGSDPPKSPDYPAESEAEDVFDAAPKQHRSVSIAADAIPEGPRFIVPSHAERRMQLPASVRPVQPGSLQTIECVLAGQTLHDTDLQHIATSFPRPNHAFTLAPDIEPAIQSLMQTKNARRGDDRPLRALHQSLLRVFNPLLILDELTNSSAPPSADEVHDFVAFTFDYLGAAIQQLIAYRRKMAVQGPG